MLVPDDEKNVILQLTSLKTTSEYEMRKILSAFVHLRQLWRKRYVNHESKNVEPDI